MSSFLDINVLKHKKPIGGDKAINSNPMEKGNFKEIIQGLRDDLLKLLDPHHQAIVVTNLNEKTKGHYYCLKIAIDTIRFTENSKTKQHAYDYNFSTHELVVEEKPASESDIEAFKKKLLGVSKDLGDRKATCYQQA
mgnify:CR=1 FL=1